MLDRILVVAGIIIAIIVMSDVFQSVIVPRPASRAFRPSAWVSVWGWRGWSSALMLVRNNDLREDLLGIYAPLLLVSLLGMWVVLLVCAYGLIFFGMREGIKGITDFPSALYFAGTSLITIGYGDIVATSGWARLFSVTAGATGFAVVAVVTTFLYSVLQQFQAREVFVVMLGTRAGSPPSGVTFVENVVRLGIGDSLPAFLREGQRWMAQLMESHLSYPVLTYFRSSHDYESWVATIGTLLDASTIAITCFDVGSVGEARLTNALGRHLVKDFVHYFNLPPSDEIGVERHEFDLAFERLAAAGVPLVSDRDRAWELFSETRRTYAGALNAMARWWRIPPAQWVGDRSSLKNLHAVSLPGIVKDTLDARDAARTAGTERA